MILMEAEKKTHSNNITCQISVTRYCNANNKQLNYLTLKIEVCIQPVYNSPEIGNMLKLCDTKPPLVS